MAKTILLGHILHIPVKVHWSLLAFFGVLALLALPAFFTAPASASLILLVYLGIFCTILLHELGHSVVAIRFGSDVVDIILTPIGGVARIRRMPEKAVQELLVAIAGPMVNVVLVLIAAVYLGSFTPMLEVVARVGEAYFDPQAAAQQPIEPIIDLTQAIALLGGLNLVIAVFNMLPGFPMDGGRVLRSALTPAMGYEKATLTAVLVGRVVAAGFAFWGLVLLFEYGLVGGLILAIIAAFLWVTGAAELFAVQRRGLVRGYRARDVMAPDLPVLAPSMPLQEALGLIAGRQESGLPVLDEAGYLVGWLDARAAAMTPAPTVGMGMRPRVKWVLPDDPLDRTMQAIEETGIPAVPVTDLDGRYHGTITIAHLQAFLLERLQQRLAGGGGKS